MDQITLGVFSPSVLLDVARSTGRLSAAGLAVSDVAVPSSPAQFESLRDGAFDVVFTSPDNVLGYRFLPSNPLRELLDVEIVAGVDRGLGLVLAAAPGVAVPEGLRGARLAVDVPASGFAFVAYALLQGLGISRHDVDVVALGSTPKRASALCTGGCEVTVLNAGNELNASARGAQLLAEVGELGPYLGTVVARMRQAPRRAAVDRLVAVLADTAGEIVSGRLRPQACESAARLLGLPHRDAAEHVRVLTDPNRGLITDGAVAVAALDTLVELRRAFGPVPELDGIAARYGELVRPAALVG